MENVVIADVVKDCVTLFNGISSLITTRVKSAADAELASAVDEQAARFRIWAGNIGVFAEAHASLDYRLRDNPDAKGLALHQLSAIQDSLNRIITLNKDGGVIGDGIDLDDGSSSAFGLKHSLSDADDLFSDIEARSVASRVDRSPFQEEFLAIADKIGRLYRLSVRIRRPSSLTQNLKAESYVIRDEEGKDASSRFRDYARRIVAHRCPNLAPLLQDRLTSTILTRRKRFLYRQRHQQKLDPGGLVPTVRDSDLRRHRADSTASTAQFQPMRKGDGLLRDLQTRQIKNHPPSVTSASYVPSVGGTGTATATRSTASTTFHMGSSQDLDISVPPPPKIVGGSTEFQCHFCFMILSADEADPKRWKKHVLKDLEPYFCLFNDCTQPLSLFPSRSSWISHMRTHTYHWLCPGPRHEPKSFHTEEEFDAHLRADHGDYLSNDQIPYIKKQRQRSLDFPLSNCPFCPELVFPDVSSPSGAYSDQVSNAVNDHVQQHLQHFALMSLPWLDDTENSDDTSSGRTMSSARDTSEPSDTAISLTDECEDVGSDERPGDDEDIIIRDLPVTSEGSTWQQEWGFMPSSLSYRGQELDPVLQKFLRRLYLGSSVESYSVQGPVLPCYVLPPSGIQSCFGREAVIESIAKVLVPGRPQLPQTVESEPPSGLKVFVLCGPGGMGKSHVASGFVANYLDSFDAVFWVHGDSRAKLLSDYRNIAIELGLVVKSSVDARDQSLTKDLVKTWLIKPRKVTKSDKKSEHPTTRWLLIFDGVDDAALISEFWPYDGPGSILITSRDSLAFTNKLNLLPFSAGEATQFLLHATNKEHDPNERIIAPTVARRVGGFPLALNQMASMITRKEWSFQEFLEAYDTRESRDLESPQDLYKHKLAAMWAFENLEYGRRLLNVLSMIDADGISEQLLITLYQEPVSHIAYQRAKASLLQSSLILEHKNSRKLSLHRLVQDVTRMQMTPELYCTTFLECVHMLSSAWPHVSFTWRHGTKRWSACEELFPHVLRLMDLEGPVAVADNGIDGPFEFIKLLMDVGWYSYERGGSEDAIRLSNLAQSILESLRAKNAHKDRRQDLGWGDTDKQIESALAEIQHNRGCFAADTNQPIDTMKYHSVFHKMMIAESSTGFPRDDMRLAISWNELGNAYMLNCDWYKGEQCYVQSIEAMKALDEFHPLQLSLPQINLGSAYWLTGRSTEAAELLTETLAEREKVYGPDDRESFITGRVLQALGNVKTTQGYLEESFAYHRRALLQYKSTLGNNHHRTADLCVRVAGHHKRLRHWDLALAVLNQALRIYSDENVYLPERLRARFSRSEIYRAQGKTELAEKDTLLCLAGYRRLKPGSRGLPPAVRDFDKLIPFWSR